MSSFQQPGSTLASEHGRTAVPLSTVFSGCPPCSLAFAEREAIRANGSDRLSQAIFRASAAILRSSRPAPCHASTPRRAHSASRL